MSLKEDYKAFSNTVLTALFSTFADYGIFQCFVRNSGK